MNFNQSNEQLKQNIAHLKIVYEKEKAELEAMEAQSRALEQEVERKSARNNQLRCGIYDKLSNFMDTTATTCAMGKMISKASKDIEKELEKVDACDAEMVQVQNELKAELQRTIDDFDEDKVQDRIEALQIQKHELEAKLERRRIVFTDLVEKNRLKKEAMERIRQQNLEKTLELQSKVYEIREKLLKIKFKSEEQA